MQTQAKFWFCFTKINTKLFSAVPALLLILSIGPSPNFKTFLRLSVFDGRPVEMKKFWGGGLSIM